MDLGLKGKRALVLASSSGIGLSIAKTLASEGAKVAITSSNKAKIEQAAEQVSSSIPFVCDLSKQGEAKALVQRVANELGAIDILVTNTGGPPKGTFEQLTSEQWIQGFQLVFLSAIEAMRECLPFMRQQKWGRILNVLSVSALQPVEKLTLSTGYRAGLLGLSKSICHEVAEDQITINTLLPGYTATQRLKSFAPEETLIRDIPMKRLGTPEELAALAAFLSSEHAGYITGQSIAFDGGLMR
jgi:3-oxoacyl-[acyl-carrier protein] reductase